MDVIFRCRKQNKKNNANVITFQLIGAAAATGRLGNFKTKRTWIIRRRRRAQTRGCNAI